MSLLFLMHSLILQALLEDRPTLMELDLSSQASNLLVILRVHISQDGVFAVGDLLWQIDCLLQLDIALLERAIEIDVLDVVAQVGFGVDNPDQTELDLQLDVGAFFDVFGESAACNDVQGVAAVWGVKDMGVGLGMCLVAGTHA